MNGVLSIPQNASITQTSPSNYLVSYHRLSLVGGRNLTLRQSSSQCILLPQLTGPKSYMVIFICGFVMSFSYKFIFIIYKSNIFNSEVKSMLVSISFRLSVIKSIMPKYFKYFHNKVNIILFYTQINDLKITDGEGLWGILCYQHDLIIYIYIYIYILDNI